MFIIFALLALYNTNKNANLRIEEDPNILDVDSASIGISSGENIIPSSEDDKDPEDQNPSTGNIENPPEDQSSSIDDVHSEEDVPNESEKPSYKMSSLLIFILENIDSLLNDGVNKATFNKYFNLTESPNMLENYSRIIDSITDESLVIFPDIEEIGYISNYFNLSTTLYSISPKIKEILEKNKESFKLMKSIFNELAPDVAKAANVDLKKLESLYDYILINDNNDGVLFGEIFKILGISTNWVPKFKEFISVFDAKSPISKLFSGLNVYSEYRTCIQKVQLLNVPKNNDDEKFFSINRASDAILSVIDLIRNAYDKNVKAYYNDPILPLINNYLLKPINIFDVSIYDRATSLLAFIDNFQKFSNNCENNKEDDQIANIKCELYDLIQDLLSESLCDNEQNEICRNKVFNTIKGYITDFTYPEVNLTNLLIDKYGFPPKFTQFLAQLIADLTDSKKNYLGILQGTINTIGNVNISNIPYSSLVERITNVVNFIRNLGPTSNFTVLVENLNLLPYWISGIDYMDEIRKPIPLCNLSYFEDYYQTCQNFTEYAQSYINLLLSNETIGTFASEGIIKMALDMGIPIAQALTNKFSELLSTAYKNLIPIVKEFEQFQNISFPEQVKFANVFEKSFSILDQFISLIDYISPQIAKILPAFNEYYPRFIEKTHKVFNVFIKDQDIISLFNALYDGSGIIFQMIRNLAVAYKDDKTTFNELIRAIKPTTFLNVFETIYKINQTEELTLHTLAEAITYDNSDSIAKLLAESRDLTLNDIIPFKSIVLHSEELYTGLSNYNLTIGVISKSLGVTDNYIKEKLNSIIRPIVSVPRDFVKDVITYYFKAQEKDVDAILDNIYDIFSLVAEGKPIKTSATIQPPPSSNESVATKVPAPSQSLAPRPTSTPVPIKDDIKNVTDLGSIDNVDVSNSQELQQAINKKLENINVGGSNSITIPKPKPGVNYNFDDIKIPNTTYLKLDSDVPVDYSKGDLKVLLDDKSSSIVVNAQNAADIKLSIMNTVQDMESTVKINTDKKNVAISSSSDIASPLKIVVPSDVESVKIESISLHSTATVKAIREGNTKSVPITVNVLEAAPQTKCKLEDIKVANKMTISQSARLELANVSFADADINLKLVTYTHSNYQNQPMLEGTLGEPPRNIVLTKPTDQSIPEKKIHYTLFQGTFAKGGCEQWKEAVRIDDTDFNDKICNDYYPLQEEEKEDKSLAVFTKEDDDDDDNGKRGNKLNAGAIAGIVVGCVVAVAIIVVVVIFFLRKKKQDESSQENANDGTEI